MPAKQNHTRVNVSIDTALLKQVDWLLEVRTRNRSQLIEDLLEEWVYKEQTRRQREAEGRKSPSQTTSGPRIHIPAVTLAE
jgi:metal-responsive CopG/Arc/MetJ family transcriptional regulator